MPTRHAARWCTKATTTAASSGGGRRREIPGEDSTRHRVHRPGHARARSARRCRSSRKCRRASIGYRPDRAAWNVGIEKLTRGHVLQLNFGNNFDSTPGMVARGGSPHDVYMGFNLSRKF